MLAAEVARPFPAASVNVYRNALVVVAPPDFAIL